MADSNSTRAASRARKEAQRRAFDAVLETYRELGSLHPLQAMRWDATARQSRTLGALAVEFRVDTERAVTFALQGKPELHPVFTAMLEEQPTEGKLAQQVIARCGQVFLARDLTPHTYFRKIRRGRSGRRPN